ncbi:MAG: hypothetical protein ACYSU5_19205 [Planctomycetota bacterium]
MSRYSRHNIYNLTRPDKSLILLAGLSRKAGGYAAGKAVTQAHQAAPLKEDRTKRPTPVEHPIVFEDVNDPDYRKILAHIMAAKAKLEEIKRFDMPGFRPNEHYVREMKRYGIIARSFDPHGPLDVYATDRAYFKTFWYKPTSENE